jgi:hypothetical protein
VDAGAGAEHHPLAAVDLADQLHQARLHHVDVIALLAFVEQHLTGVERARD